MKLSLRYPAMLMSLVGITTCNIAYGATDPGRILGHFRHYGKSNITSARLEGIVGGAPYSVAGTRRGSQVIFDVSLNGTSVQLHFSSEQFPSIDLRTIHEGVNLDLTPHRLAFDLRFGEVNNCFVNDDGRRLLAISVAADGVISVSRSVPAGCAFTWQEVDMARTGPATYSALPPRSGSD